MNRNYKNNKGCFNLYDSVKNNKNRRNIVKRKENTDERMNQVGNYHDYHSLLPKRNKVLRPNIDVPSELQEKWTHCYDFNKMTSLKKNLWNLIVQVHPSIMDGNAVSYLSYYFDKLVVVANHQDLREWKKAGFQKAIEACKIHLQSEEDSDDDSDSNFFGNNLEIVGTSNNYEREIENIKEFLLCLSINPVFDSHFITEEINDIRVYCPCHKIMSKWNKLSGVDEILDENDICNVKKSTFKNVTGFKSHITSLAKSSSIHLAMQHYINHVYSKSNLHFIKAYIKDFLKNQDRFGYSLKKMTNQPRSQLLFTNLKTGITAERILPQKSSTYNSVQQHKENGVTNTSRDKLKAWAGDSDCNNSKCKNRGDDAKSNGNHSRGWGGDSSSDINNSSVWGVHNSSNSNNSLAWGDDSSTNISTSKRWGEGDSQNWGTKETSSNGWVRMNTNDAIVN